MHNLTTKQIKIDITVCNNGINKSTSIDGFAFIEAGFLSGKFSMDEGVTKTEQLITTAFSFTGCPIAARTEMPEINPWLLTNGSYENKRILVSNQFVVTSKLKSVGWEDKINMNLNLIIEGDITSLHSIKKPFQESIFQTSRGKLEGRFKVEFATLDSSTIEAEAVSNYHLNINADVLPVWRNILILNFESPKEFKQIEQIDLFNNKTKADEDLSSKLNVVTL